MTGDPLLQPFVEFAFMRRALVGCLALSLGAAPVGVFLMLRRLTLTGDAMQHALLPGVAIGYMLGGMSLLAMTAGGFIAGLAVALLSGLVSRVTVLREDASLAAFYMISLALGVLIISLHGSRVDLLALLFGSVLALDDPALLLIAGIASVSVVTIAAVYRPLVLECFDPGFLRTVSGAGAVVHYLFLALVVANLVAGFHAIGTLLAVAVMVLPAAAARFWTAEVSRMIGVAVLISALAGPTGLLVSYHLDLPSGPAIVLVMGLAYAVSLTFGTVGSLRTRFLPGQHLRA